MASRPLPVSKLRARRRKRRVVVALLSLFGVLLLAGGLAGLTWLPYLRITHVEVAGASSVSSSKIEEVVTQRLDEKFLYLIAEDNVLLYPRAEIQQTLLRKFPAIESVEIHWQSLTSLKVSIVERSTVALWCGVSLSAPSSCYVLDKNGIAYAPAADFSGEVYIKYYGAVSSTTPRQFVTPQEFAGVSAFLNALRTKVEDDSPKEVGIENGDVKIVFGSGFTLLYNSADDEADVLERFVLALQSDPFVNHKISDFAYLDLRFGDKLYYKLRD